MIRPILAALALLAAVSAPDSPAGRRFDDLVDLAESGDAAKIQAYVDANFSAGMREANPGDSGIAGFLAGQAERFGGFDVVRELAATDDQVVMLVRPRKGPERYYRYIVKVESAEPHLVEGLFLMPATPGDIPVAGAALTPDEAVSRFAKELDRLIPEQGFSGVVLLAHGDDVVLERHAGEADREHHAPVTPDSVFSIASMNKMFTAVAIGKLVERGKLGWDDPVAAHLKGWLPKGAESITVAQLLSHTSGLGDYLDAVKSDPAIRDARSLGAYREYVRASAYDGLPTEGMRYSNTGYLVLGALIESVSGKEYFDFVRDEIYRPAGMTRTDSWCRDEIVEGRAIGYVTPEEAKLDGIGDGWRSNLALLGVRGTSAGGGDATAPDLLRFARALVGGKLVKPETLDALLAPRVRFAVGGDYAYGFVVHRGKDGRRVFGHSGGIRGVSAELKVYGDGAWTLVVLSNLTRGAGDVVGAWDGIEAKLGP